MRNKEWTGSWKEWIIYGQYAGGFNTFLKLCVGMGMNAIAAKIRRL